ncbi:hypothetical protein [Verrucomicrobium sp. GAS474]|uniref:hypothetical protein n=1 Tax=Verrucomicrobium sp. GAS474 TaxID=1882831 RepID=UPI0012FF99DE|nr:hypothetical protein [Verrucomicrobium sp. GAS474]
MSDNFPKTEFIELIRDEGNGPLMIRVDAINSITFIPADSSIGRKDMIWIKIASWEKPYIYESDQAKAVYDGLNQFLKPSYTAHLR